MGSIIGLIILVLVIIAFFKVTAFAARMGLGVLALLALLLIIVPLMAT